MPDPITRSSTPSGPTFAADAIVSVYRVTPMRRLLSFAGRSIDDVVNCPVSRRHVAFYFRVGKQIERAIDVVDLERQWNPRGLR